MKKVLVFQHMAHEILGTLDPLLRKSGYRIQYVNFDRDPDAQPAIDKYDSLVILGGPMGVYEAEKYKHLKTEMRAIEDALRKDIPILGICLGSQLLAHVLGGEVRKHHEREMGWFNVHMTDEGLKDPVFGHFQRTEKVFQSHGDTFDVPKSAVHLAWSELCPGQAFRYGNKVFAMQFHLEVDQAHIDRWLTIPFNVRYMCGAGSPVPPEKVVAETKHYLPRSVALSNETWTRFLKIAGEVERQLVLDSGHGKPKKV